MLIKHARWAVVNVKDFGSAASQCSKLVLTSPAHKQSPTSLCALKVG